MQFASEAESISEEFQLNSKYELYSNDNGMVLVTSEIRMNVMRELTTNKKLTLADLSRNLKISQSTLATNLIKMTEDGLIVTEPDQIDSRKVFYSSIAHLAVSSTNQDTEALKSAENLLKDASVKPENFYRDLMLHLSLKTRGKGIDIAPSFKSMGYNLGMELYDIVKADTVEDLIVNIKNYFNESDIGELNVYTFVPLTLTLKNETTITDSARHLLSEFVFGLFIALLLKHTGREYRVTKSEVFSNGIIKFTVDIVPKA